MFVMLLVLQTRLNNVKTWYVQTTGWPLQTPQPPAKWHTAMHTIHCIMSQYSTSHRALKECIPPPTSPWQCMLSLIKCMLSQCGAKDRPAVTDRQRTLMHTVRVSPFYRSGPPNNGCCTLCLRLLILLYLVKWLKLTKHELHMSKYM